MIKYGFFFFLWITSHMLRSVFFNSVMVVQCVLIVRADRWLPTILGTIQSTVQRP